MKLIDRLFEELCNQAEEIKKESNTSRKVRLAIRCQKIAESIQLIDKAVYLDDKSDLTLLGNPKEWF